MARNLLTLPSVDEDDYLVNLADWVEATAIFSADRNASREDLKKALSRDGDSKDERAEQIANDVFTELEDRAKACGESGKGKNNYPFSLDSTRTLLTLSASPVTDDVIIYIFLLAITRGDMSSSTRKMAGLDPTKVFERMYADVLLNFWGGQTAHSDSLIFGTARPKTKAGQVFPTNITNLCEKLKEGGGWKNGAQS